MADTNLRLIWQGGQERITDGGRPAEEHADRLTAHVLDHASIMVYANFGSGAFPLPYRSDAGGTFNIINYTRTAGTITIRRNTDGCTTSSCLVALSTVIQYRYVIIPDAS